MKIHKRSISINRDVYKEILTTPSVDIFGEQKGSISAALSDIVLSHKAIMERHTPTLGKSHWQGIYQAYNGHTTSQNLSQEVENMRFILEDAQAYDESIRSCLADDSEGNFWQLFDALDKTQKEAILWKVRRFWGKDQLEQLLDEIFEVPQQRTMHLVFREELGVDEVEHLDIACESMGVSWRYLPSKGVFEFECEGSDLAKEEIAKNFKAVKSLLNSF